MLCGISRGFDRVSCKWLWAVAIVLFLGRGAEVLAMWVNPARAPVERLIANISRYIEEHPNDAQGYYTLGRVHGLAFVLRTRQIAYQGPRSLPAGKLPRLAPDWMQKAAPPGTGPTPPGRDELLRHLSAAVRYHIEAIRRDPAPAHYHLGLAYVLEQGLALAGQVDVLPRIETAQRPPGVVSRIEGLVQRLGDADPAQRAEARRRLEQLLAKAAPVLHRYRNDANPARRSAVRDLLRAYWREQAIHHYYAAFQRSVDEDLKHEFRPLAGLQSLISYEAGNGYLRLVRQRGPRDAAERRRLREVEQKVEQLKRLPKSGIVTPIIFSVSSPATLEQLLDPQCVVRFDLDGDGRAEQRPWVRPDTAILAWNPDGSGRITSGRQLFGSVTWWLFFADGYRALDALDDDRDGWLRGDELRGLAAWFDRDSDGISDAGEVVPLARLGVEALATHWVGRQRGMPFHPAGLRLRSGRAVPTYDWIAPPATDVTALSVPMP